MLILSQTRTVTHDGNDAIITPRRNARRIIARRNAADGTLRITVPYGISMAQALPIIERLAGQLNRIPAPSTTGFFREGMEIPCRGITFRITRQKFKPGAVLLCKNATDIDISVGADLDIGSQETTMAINRALIKAAHHVAPQLLLPRARALAEALNLHPAGWDIGHGKRTLGTCHSNRTITLSCLLVFLPLHLRDYIVHHELAHLSEMNHSDRFHRLCDAYCQGREKELSRELKNHKWAILR